MSPPTITQQRGFAIAPRIAAVLSFISSCYVIYYILYKERLGRLYHRLVLGMNVALIMLAFSYIWGTAAVPEGTPYYVGAKGTINTCTAQGFICVMFAMVVPIYYASLVLQSYCGIKNNFQEAKYIWVEKWIHLVAWCFPLVVVIVLATTENINPYGGGCWYGKSPRECETDPIIPCERGEDIGPFLYIVGITQISLYFIFPPAVVIAMYCWIRRVHKKMSSCSGMHQVREAARKEMLNSIRKQISLYLLAFWSTFVLGLASNAYKIISGGGMLYNLHLLASSIFAFQGFVFMIVYFTLEKIGTPKVECLPHLQSERMTRNSTVHDIRTNAERKSAEQGTMKRVSGSSRRDSCVYNIFDGTPDMDSPWAQFIDPDSDNEEGIIDEEGGIRTGRPS